MHAQQCHTVGQDQNFSKPKSIVALLYHWGDPLMQKSHNRCILQFSESMILKNPKGGPFEVKGPQ